MIFSDQKTADEFRGIARTQILASVRDLIDEIVSDHPEEWIKCPDPIKLQHVEHVLYNQPSLYRTLLQRSGIIHSSSYGDVHDCVLYYDDDSTRGDYRVAQAIRSTGMVGGINKIMGSTHT